MSEPNWLRSRRSRWGIRCGEVCVSHLLSMRLMRRHTVFRCRVRSGSTNVASALAAEVGDEIHVGALKLSVAAILSFEPDRGVNFFSVAPRLLMNLADLEGTGLIQLGSRVGYRLLLAGEPHLVKSFRERASEILERGERLEDADNARPEIRTALDRAQKFLGIAAMLWVGGHIILVGVNELGWHPVYEFVHHAEEAVAHAVPGGLGGFLGWLVNTLASAVIGLFVGAIVVGVTHLIPHKKKDAHGAGRPAAEGDPGEASESGGAR